MASQILLLGPYYNHYRDNTPTFLRKVSSGVPGKVIKAFRRPLRLRNTSGQPEGRAETPKAQQKTPGEQERHRSLAEGHGLTPPPLGSAVPLRHGVTQSCRLAPSACRGPPCHWPAARGQGQAGWSVAWSTADLAPPSLRCRAARGAGEKGLHPAGLVGRA
uniref:Uncharacterized protein n=1 Tax=Pelusios castaneus TaxID=367368 RepID=A0A8C8R9Z5_9SAUR